MAANRINYDLWALCKMHMWWFLCFCRPVDLPASFVLSYFEWCRAYWGVVDGFVSRAGKPPPGLHLDVVKGDKLVEVRIIRNSKCLSDVSYLTYYKNRYLFTILLSNDAPSSIVVGLVGGGGGGQSRSHSKASWVPGTLKIFGMQLVCMHTWKQPDLLFHQTSSVQRPLSNN